MKTQGKDTRAARLEEAIRRRRQEAQESSVKLPLRPTGRERLLGETQMGIWLLQQLEPASPAYHLASAFRISGGLDIGSLERALNEVVARHRILRSTFLAQGDNVLQIVHQELLLPVEKLVASKGQASVTAIEQARRPFDLESGPLLRMLLVEEPQGERLLVLVVHHLLADARSMDIFWRDFERTYTDSAASEPTGPQYDDYEHWARQQDPKRRATDLAFWARRLEPPPGELALPFEEADGVLPESGRLLRQAFPTDLRRKTEAVAAAMGMTPFVVLAFTFRLLLQRYTDSREVAFATPVSTRSHPDAAEMIGYFLNPVLVHTKIDETLPVDEALRVFNRELRGCLKHASIPFHTLVESLSPPRSRGRHPLFQAMFVYRETTRPPRLGNSRLEPTTLDLGVSKFDLTLFVTVGEAESELAIEYRADRFGTYWMRGLVRHFTVLLDHMEVGLRGPTAKLPLLRSEEYEQLERSARGTPFEPPSAPLAPQRILDQAGRRPAAPAVVGAGGEWTYADLQASALRIAHTLAHQGVQPAERVGLFLDRSPLMIGAVLGVHCAGAAYVPLDPNDPPERTRVLLNDARLSALITRSDLEQRLPSTSIPRLIADAPGASATDPCSALESLRPEDPAYILYTSGSTGTPKGVVVSHANLLASTAARSEVYETRPERFLLLPSLAFDSSVAGIFWTLAEGGTLILPSEDELISPRQLARLVADREATMLLCVPSLYRRILKASDNLLRTVQTVIVAGESCPARLPEQHFRKLPRSRLFNEYGPTEATVWATVHEFDPSDSRHRIAIGRPIPGVRVDVLDSLGRPVPAGIHGEAWISGPTVAGGYWRRPQLTEERFGRRPNRNPGQEPSFRSGDRLSWTTDGLLLFHGRLDDQIKLRGYRIEPGEVESALRRLPGVDDAAVVLRDGQQLAAFVTASGPVAEWREALASQLPTFMLPNRLTVLDDLPQLPNGKLDRRQLEAVELESEISADTRVTPETDRERAMVSLWESLLDRTGIGVTDNFFHIGGHSLLAVEMAALLERDLGILAEPIEVFQSPTIRGLLSRLERQESGGTISYAHLFPLQPKGDRTPLVFCIPHFFSEMIVERFRDERPVYGLRGVGLRPEGNRGRWRTMESLGKDLVDEVVRRFRGQPVYMAGYSFGATMAFEAVRQMEALGLPVERLFLIAPMPLDFLRFGLLRLQVDALRHPLQEISTAQALGQIARHSHPLTRRFYQRVWRFVITQPCRRLLCLIGKVRTLLGRPLTSRILYADVRVERFRLHAGYQPGTVTTPTVIFNASEPETDAAATWRPFLEAPPVVHQIPDPHMGETCADAARDIIGEHLAILRAS